MLFNNCESCSEVGTRVCRCESTPHFFCDSHISNHILSSEKHSTEPALERLSLSQVSSIRDAYQKNRFHSLRQAICARNSKIESLFLKIRKVEEKCSSIIENILAGTIAANIQEVLFYQALPLFSDSSLVRSLLDLKHASTFFSPQICDLLKSLNFSPQNDSLAMNKFKVPSPMHLEARIPTLNKSDHWECPDKSVKTKITIKCTHCFKALGDTDKNNCSVCGYKSIRRSCIRCGTLKKHYICNNCFRTLWICERGHSQLKSKSRCDQCGFTNKFIQVRPIR